MNCINDVAPTHVAMIDSVPWPEHITVLDAHVDILNGVYDLDDSSPCKKWPAYTKSSGVPASARICRVTYCSSKEVWSVREDDKIMYISTKRKIYDASLPPQRGWWSVRPMSDWRPPVVLYGEDSLFDWRVTGDSCEGDIGITTSFNDKDYVHYRVHRNILQRSKNLFTDIMESSNETIEEEVIPLSLSENSARLFPYVLDFLYTMPSEFFSPVDYKTDLFLASLLDYLQLDTALNMLKSRMASTFRSGKWTNYLPHINTIDCPFLDCLVTKVVVCEISQMDNTMLSFVGRHLDIRVVKEIQKKIQGKPFQSRRNDSSPLSIVISAFLTKNDDIGKEDFSSLTKPSHLPCLRRASVFPLLEAERHVFPGNDSKESVTSLQLRCIRMLITHPVSEEEKPRLFNQTKAFIFQFGYRLGQNIVDSESEVESSD